MSAVTLAPSCSTTLVLRSRDLTLKGAVTLRRELEEIHRTYDPAIWKDPLSIKLHKWCTKVLSVPLTDRVMREDLWQAASSKKIHKLMSQILTNSVDRASLHNPMRLREYVVEEWMLSECGRLIGCWPGDGGDLTGTPHLFADAMLKWAQAFEISPDGRVRLIPLTEEEYANTDTVQMRAALIMMKVFETQGLETEKEMQKSLKKQKKAYEESTAALKDHINAELERDLALRKREQAELKASLSHIKTLHKGEQGILKGRIEGALCREEATRVDLTETQARLAATAAEVDRLNAALAQRGREMADLNARANQRRSSGDCIIS